ncbi:hypothetical protein D8Y22_03860 [Salinadaptatus halalkaliphilus]|uniref:Uncharacterized protein n=1 Tax=Salinadaptatus halalkaliphilus TaxID=2419781 RepID=A0A4S3TP16_9EURY|nr:hypothetical protein [Salinadaptatus halalkaliphilus]THE66069.1 hypothetical protein D8Y22_03860 [Salinadaptatus halalkaliphilus]
MDAVDDLSDAIDVTRNLLVPVEPWLWLKLAIVVFFLGSMTLGGGFQGDPSMIAQDPTIEDQPAPEDQQALEEELGEIPDELIQNLILAAIIIGVSLLVLWFVFRLIGGIMEFVFIESLRSNEVHVRRYFTANIGRGIRLFVFRLLVFVLAAAIVAVPLVYVFLTASSFEAMAGSILLLMLVGVGVALVQATVMRFTSEFVAPIMLLEGRGVLSGWKRLWPTLTANWSEYVVYLLLVWILQFVINIAAGIIMLFGVILVAIPFVIVGAILVATLGEIGIWLAILVAAVAVLAILLVVALVEMPIRTYFQYYALLLLGDTNDELDLIPDQRELVRDGGPAADEGGPDDRGDHPDGQWSGDDTAADRNDTDDTPVWDDDDTDPWDDRDNWGESSRDDSSDDRNVDDRDGDDDREESDDGRGW